MKPGDKVAIDPGVHTRGSMWHNGKFFTLDEYAGKEFTVGEVTETTCYLVELKHHFAKWILRDPVKLL
jgi:hypothetical protein